MDSIADKTNVNKYMHNEMVNMVTLQTIVREFKP